MCIRDRGKVTYSTGVPINRKPEKVVLTMGNIVDKLYLCEIDDHDYKGKGILFESAKPNIANNTPSIFKGEENVSWLLIKSMKEISINYFRDECTQEAIRNFIKSRANNKTLNTNQDL